MQTIINYIQNINITTDLIKFIIFFLIFSSIVFVITRLIRLYLPKVSFGLITILVWAMIINLCYFADYLEISPLVTYIGLALLVGGFIYLTVKNKNINLRETLADKESSYLMKLYFVWYVGLFLILVPFIFILPKNTIIPEAAVSSDSVVHTLLSMGKALNEKLRLNPYWSVEYPRGFHSVIYYVNAVLRIEARSILLPMVALGYSFMVFFVEEVTSKLNFLKGFKKGLIMLLPLTSFFMITAAYALFVPQITVIPLLLMSVWLTFSFELFTKEAPSERRLLRILFLFILVLAVTNVYGIYALNVLIVGFIIHVLFKIFKTFKAEKSLKLEMTKVFTVLKTQKMFYFLLAISLFIFSIPTIILAYNNITSTFLHPAISFGGTGNLSNFLSLFHLSGTWPPGLEYRAVPDESDSYFLFLILIIEIFFIFKAKLSKRIVLTNVVLILMLLASLIVFKNPYIHFKFLSYYVPLFLVTFGISFFEYFKDKKFKIRNLPVIIFSIFIFTTLLLPYKSYKAYPAATRDTFESFEYIKKNYIDNSKTLILATDVWMQYYLKDSTDDFAPLNNYAFPSLRFNNEQFDIIITDSLYGAEERTNDFFEKNPEIYSKVSKTPLKCISEYQRFTIYDLNCK